RGGTVGLGIAWAGGAALSRAFNPDALPPTLADPRTVGFAAAVALTVGTLTGLVPALWARRGDLVGSLKSGAREGSYQRSRIRTLLVVVQGALSAMLVVGAGQLGGSLQRAMGQPLDSGVAPGD